MARIVKTYNDTRDSIIEVAVNAVSEGMAKKRGKMYVLLRMPLKAGSIQEVETMDVTEASSRVPGSEYRVMVTIDSDDEIGDLIDF